MNKLIISSTKRIKMQIKKNTISTLLLSMTLASCASAPQPDVDEQAREKYSVEKSFLANGKLTDQNVNSNSATNGSNEQSTSNRNSNSSIAYLETLNRGNVEIRQGEELANKFSDVKSLTVSVNEFPIQNYLHYVFGELLNVNYVLDKELSSDSQSITLNIQEQISPRRLMTVTTELLASHGMAIKYNEDVYYIHKVDTSDRKGKNVVTGVGRDLSSVPQTSQDILQIVPLKFGVKISIERTLRNLVGVKIETDADQSALFLQGKRQDILRALEFIHLLDAPANRGKHIGLITLTFIDAAKFTEQITSLLENEGIPVAVNKAAGKNLVIVPVNQIGAVAVFAADRLMLTRVKYWADIIDKPLKTANKQYFMYHPQYARASDLGESLSALLGGTGQTSSNTNNSNNNNSNNKSTGNAPSSSRKTGVKNEDLTLVVDERANAIIFHTSGSSYQSLLPLIKKLDVLPRQVMLDITIAEVTLTDEFKYGVEWAINNGDVSISTLGAFGVDTIGGLKIGVEGVDGEVNASFNESNGLVKVLSNPTLLVRDGVSANINVGSEISLIGQTTEDPINGDRQTTSVEGRQTGVDVSVTPSINAQGIVIMEVNQKISNTVPDTTGAGGNPDIFERSLKTEVVAQSGETIILGGLISENTSNNDKKTPWIADVPVIGGLFKSTGDSKERTELIMLITPKVIDSLDQWDDLKSSFQQGLEYLSVE